MSRIARAWAALLRRDNVRATTRVSQRLLHTGKRAGDVIDGLLGIAAEQSVSRLLSAGHYKRLREQARELAKTSPLIARYVTVSVENVWGPSGITLQSMPARTRGNEFNKTLAKDCEWAFYDRWAPTADVSGGSFDAAMRWFVERYKVDGEAALELVYDRSLRYGVGVRRIDADLIDWDLKQTRSRTSPAIVNGVEIDGNGKPVAYHVLSHRQVDVPWLGAITRRRVPADRMVVWKFGHGIRGVTPLAAVMENAGHLTKMQSALVALYRAAACKMGFLVRKQGGETLSADPGSDVVSMDVASGVIEQLPEGMEFQSWDPTAPGDQYATIYGTLVHEIAAGLRTTYTALTGDLKEANYSSMRQGELMARDGYRVDHADCAEVALQPIYAAVIRGARTAGDLVSTLPNEAITQAAWHGRTWPWVDPQKDALAIRELLALGLTTRTRELNALGLAAPEVFAELSEEIALMESLNIPTVVTTAQAQAAAAESAPRLVA